MISFILKTIMTGLTVFVLICGIHYIHESGAMVHLKNSTVCERLHRGAKICQKKLYEIYQKASQPGKFGSEEGNRNVLESQPQVEESDHWAPGIWSVDVDGIVGKIAETRAILEE